MQAPEDFDYYLFGTRVRLAEGCAAQLPGTVADLGCSRPVLLMQARVAGSPAGRALEASLAGLDCRVVRDVPQHGSVQHVQALRAAVQAHRPDCLVAVGGGSVADTAKALALLLAEGGSLSDHATRFVPPDRVLVPRLTAPKLPIISVPTTASAAEVTPSIGLADGARKQLWWCRDVAATEVLIDPALSADVPQPLLLATAINGVAHCLEGLYSRRRSPASDALALQSLGLFAAALTKEAGAAPAARRRQILAAAHLSGLVLSMARTCLHHAICHVLGARYRLRHGQVNCVILPHALRFNAEAAAPALARALRAVNEATGAGWRDTAQWIEQVRSLHGLPCSLAELGVRREDLPALAGHVMGERGLAVNPRPVSAAAEVLALLETAMAPPAAPQHI